MGKGKNQRREVWVKPSEVQRQGYIQLEAKIPRDRLGGKRKCSPCVCKVSFSDDSESIRNRELWRFL